MENVLEHAVKVTYDGLHRREPQFCSCAQCQDDVIGFALNQLRPRYVSDQPLGAALTRVALETDGARAELAVVVYEAMRRVARSPRH